MSKDKDTMRYIAEKLRLAAKHQRLAAQRLQEIYNIVKPEDMPPFEDPNQLKMFGE